MAGKAAGPDISLVKSYRQANRATEGLREMVVYKSTMCGVACAWLAWCLACSTSCAEVVTFVSKETRFEPYLPTMNDEERTLGELLFQSSAEELDATDSAAVAGYAEQILHPLSWQQLWALLSSFKAWIVAMAAGLWGLHAYSRKSHPTSNAWQISTHDG